MATSRSSPVLVRHISPPHTLDTLTVDLNLGPLLNMPNEIPAEPTPEAASRPAEMESEQNPRAQEGTDGQEQSDVPVADVPLNEPRPQQETPDIPTEPRPTSQSALINPDNPSSPPEAEAPSSTHAETEATPTSQSASITPDNPFSPPEAETPTPTPAEPEPTPASQSPSIPPENPSSPPEAETPTSTPAEPEPAPPPPQPNHPEWVTWEDDVSVPTEEELKDAQATEESALDVPVMEQKVYEEWDDPEQRPAKKIRLSWIIKGIRGTKERPNMARVMNSPTALVDGHYWQIKFFPRGNKSTSLSAYIRCTKRPPTPDVEVPESTFAYFEGPPDANMGEGAEPKTVLHVPATPTTEEKSGAPTQAGEPGASRDTGAAPAANQSTPAESELESPVSDEMGIDPPANVDYRISAQLGMVIYNPEEPRTHHFNSSEHQFTKHNDDWGWTNFVGPWNEIHKRQRGQRQALLKNDTIAIDAYIRIFDDPSQALWWHVSHDHETNWPSKQLAGYFPMGTPPLYHSPAVAGITALLLLAPFRKILQGVDAGAWRTNSQIKPRPLIGRLQGALHLMRHLRREDYVNVNPVIDALQESGETFNDVKSFWEVFRRSIEIELEGETDALQRISSIFDTEKGHVPVQSLPVKGAGDVQSALTELTLPKEIENTPPNFLPLMLEREIFDKKTCEWKLCYDSMTLNDEVSLSNGTHYTLYGFMVHVGVRNSGKFYSVLRPNGPGTKWLAFEDGDGNKVFSYTRKKIQEYEGLTGDELKNFKSTRQTAYMAMYIKSSCVEEYLPGKLEDYTAPPWLAAVINVAPDNYDTELRQLLDNGDKRGIDIEIYSDEGIIGRRGLLDMYNIKQQSLAKDHYWTFRLFTNTTFKEIRQSLASQLGIDDVKKLRLFVMSYGEVGQFNSAQWNPVWLVQKISQASTRRPLCLWLSILKTDEGVKNFGHHDPPVRVIKIVKDEERTEDIPAVTIDELLAGNSPAIVAPEATPAERTTDGNSNQGTEVVANQPPSNENTEHPSDENTAQDTVDTTLAPGTLTIQVTASENPQESSEAAPINVMSAIDGEAPVPAPEQAGSETTVPSEPPTQELQAASPQLEADAAVATAISQPTEHVASTNPAVQTSQETLQEAIADLVPSTTEADTSTNEATSQMTTAEVRPSSAEADSTANEPTSQEPAPVEHGHLVDAVMTEAPPISSVGAEAVIEQTTADVRAAQGQAEEAQNRSTTPASEPESETEPDTPLSPVPNVYGFLQRFDVDEQDFFVHCTFFGKRDESAKEIVRRCMGWDPDKAFNVWHRESTLDGSLIDGRATFDEINFNDGVDIIVGEILSDSKKDELRQQGKFSNPFALSRYLRMSQRRHPVQARTTTDPVEIADFGMNYYKGPLVNGQPHGDNCVMITSHGHTYEGPLVMNEKEGSNGKMTHQNGDVYEGAWKNDERHGHGTLVEKRTGNTYEGGFQNGKRWGKGVTRWQVADEEADMCQICYGEEIDALFFDCGHVCSCVECAKQCDVCPICRRTVKQVVRMFWA